MSCLDVHHRPTRRQVTIATTGVALLGTLTVDVRLAGPVSGIDVAIMGNLIDIDHPSSILQAARAASDVGETWPVLALALLGARRRIVGGESAARSALRAAAIVGGGALARNTMCTMIGRPRPDESGWYADPVGHSFPSRHTTMATLGLLSGAFSGSAGYLFAVPVGCVVAASRVYLEVHWPSDVVAGLAFALLWTFFIDRVLFAAATAGGADDC